MNMLSKHLLPAALAAILAIAAIAGCAKPAQAPLPIGNLRIGVANFTQPVEPSDMLAGYILDDAPRIDEKVLSEMDAVFASVMAKEAKRGTGTHTGATQCAQKVAEQEGRSNNQAALRRWSAIGRCMGVDLLIVPQMLYFQDRDGSEFGVMRPAHVVMDIFVVDVRNEVLISRSRFDESQSSLSSNLLEADKFFKRGGKWISGADLAREGMSKAIKELRL